MRKLAVLTGVMTLSLLGSGLSAFASTPGGNSQWLAQIPAVGFLGFSSGGQSVTEVQTNGGYYGNGGYVDTPVVYPDGTYAAPGTTIYERPASCGCQRNTCNRCERPCGCKAKCNRCGNGNGY